MSTNSQIDEATVQDFIYSNARYTIWSPCTTLERMHIESYPHKPSANRFAMKRVLVSLHDRGVLRRRDRLHSHYTFNEVAYERVE